MTVMPTPRAAEGAQPFTVTVPKRRTEAAPVTLLRVTGEADANILARIIQPMVKLDLFPLNLNVARDDEGMMQAEIAFSAADAAQVKRLENTLRAVIGVASVELR